MKSKGHHSIFLASLSIILLIITFVLSMRLFPFNQEVVTGAAQELAQMAPVETTLNDEAIHVNEKNAVNIIETNVVNEAKLVSQSDTDVNNNGMMPTSHASFENLTKGEDKNSWLLSIERVDYSISNKKGETVGITYYDKPVLFEDSEIVASINKYFKNECEEFFFGKYKVSSDFDRDYNRFSKQVLHAIETNFLEVSEPFFNTVQTEVICNNDENLSFLQKAFWNAGGCTPKYCYGTTFNMNTGELTNLDHFIGIDITQFRDKIETFIIEKFIEWDGDGYPTHYYDNLKAMLDSMEFKDFNYYYNGEAVFLLFNDVVIHDGCYEIRWDLNSGELSGNQLK